MDWFDILARTRCNSDLFLILYTQVTYSNLGMWLRADYWLTCIRPAAREFITGGI